MMEAFYRQVTNEETIKENHYENHWVSILQVTVAHLKDIPWCFNGGGGQGCVTHQVKVSHKCLIALSVGNCKAIAYDL